MVRHKHTLGEGRTGMLALQPSSKTRATTLFNGRSAHQAKQPEGHPSAAGKFWQQYQLPGPEGEPYSQCVLAASAS